MNQGLILVCAVFLLPLTGLAQFSGNNKRKATDLILFPNKGQVITKFTHSTTVAEDKIDFQMQEYSSSETTSSELSLSAMYAFTESLAFDIKLAQLISYEDETTFGPASSSNGETLKTERSGVRDPKLGVTYRLRDMSTDQVDINVGLDVSPEMQDAEDPSENAKGNAAKGGTDISANILIGKRNTSFAWAAGIEIEQDGESESKDATDRDITNTESHTTFNLLGAIKVNAGDVFSLDLGSTLGSTGQFRVTYSDGTFWDYENTSVFTLFGRGNFQVGDDVYFTVGVQGAAIGERILTDENANVLTQKENTVGNFSLGFAAQF